MLGQQLGAPVVDPGLLGDGGGDPVVVAGEHNAVVHPERVQPPDDVGGVIAQCVGHGEYRENLLSVGEDDDSPTGAFELGERRGEPAVAGRGGRSADEQSVAVHRGLHAYAGVACRSSPGTTSRPC